MYQDGFVVVYTFLFKPDGSVNLGLSNLQMIFEKQHFSRNQINGDTVFLINYLI